MPPCRIGISPFENRIHYHTKKRPGQPCHAKGLCAGLRKNPLPRARFMLLCRLARCAHAFLGSSMAEPSTVNRVVAGSSPARGASLFEGVPFGAPPLKIRAFSSAGERCLHTAEVAGSKPATPTIAKLQVRQGKASGLLLFSKGSKNGNLQINLQIAHGYVRFSKASAP